MYQKFMNRIIKIKQRGVILIWSLLMLPILILFFALVIDIGYQSLIIQDMKNITDTGAHAAAIGITNKEPSVKASVSDFIMQHRILGETISAKQITIEMGQWNSLLKQFILNDEPTSINAVRVSLMYEGYYFFQGFTGLNLFNQNQSSVVYIYPSNPPQIMFVQ